MTPVIVLYHGSSEELRLSTNRDSFISSLLKHGQMGYLSDGLSDGLYKQKDEYYSVLKKE